MFFPMVLGDQVHMCAYIHTCSYMTFFTENMFVDYSRATVGVVLSVSAFPASACHQCWSAGSSLSWGLSV